MLSFYTITSIFYTVLYILIIVIVSSCFLGFFQLDLFSAFLLLVEIVVVFVSFMLVFYVVNYDNINTTNLKLFFTQYSISSLWSFNILPIVIPAEPEFYLPIHFNINYLWVDFYEALNNEILNDFFGIMVGFYNVISFEFILIGVILLVGTVICVKLNWNWQTQRLHNYNPFLNLMDFFSDLVKFSIGRRQNLLNQLVELVINRPFGRKF